LVDAVEPVCDVREVIVDRRSLPARLVCFELVCLVCFELVAGEFESTGGDAQWVPQVVTDDGGELL